MAVMISRRGWLVASAVALSGQAIPACSAPKSAHKAEGGASVVEFAGKLPDSAELRRRCRIVALLDALVEGRALARDDIGTVYQPNWRSGDDLVKYQNGEATSGRSSSRPLTVFSSGASTMNRI